MNLMVVLEQIINGLNRGTFVFFQHHRQSQKNHPILERIMFELTNLGGEYFLILLSMGVLGFLLLNRRYRTALFVLIAFLGCGLAIEGSKRMVKATRPEDARDSLMRPLQSGSYPSGHSLGSATIYTTLAFLLAPLISRRGPRYFLYAVCTGLILLIGFTRIYLGCHYLTDVIGGWSFGLGWALLWRYGEDWWMARNGSAGSLSPG